MNALLPVLCISASFTITHGQTGTCCYNEICALPMFTPWPDPFSISRSTATDAATLINSASCCPSGGDVWGNYNGASTADTICRCNDGTSFVAQTCPYDEWGTEANECSNVGSDTGCPDLQSLGGTSSGKCIISGGDGIKYVPQRCPTQVICLSGLTHVYGTYYTNSNLYYKGYPEYRILSDFLDYKIQFDGSDHWEVFGYQDVVRAYLEILSGGLAQSWDIIYTQSYTEAINSNAGWNEINQDVYPNVYELSDTIQVTEGECTESPTTRTPTSPPVTVEPTTASPATASPTTASPTTAETRESTTPVGQGSYGVKQRIVWWFSAVVTYLIHH